MRGENRMEGGRVREGLGDENHRLRVGCWGVGGGIGSCLLKGLVLKHTSDFKGGESQDLWLALVKVVSCGRVTL